MNLIAKHFRNTEKYLKAISKKKISEWLLSEGYFPEQYVLPPSFKVQSFPLDSTPKIKKLDKIGRQQITKISYPKTLLTSREFGIQHPFYYHDIIYWLMDDWNEIINHLFHNDLKIYSYSFPIPINTRKYGYLSPLRSGRMIYEWINMAEKDLVAEAHTYKLIARSDITNFYNSIYTHSIAWALHGQEKAFKDKQCRLIGNKIDRIVQYANYGRTNGIPVGSALSDLIAEIILSSIDVKVSKRLNDIDFIATRFKDDYRFLCNSEKDARKAMAVLAEELVEFNLLINESKTNILELPSGLYRQHDRIYHSHSLRDKKSINFKTFELTLLVALDIHKEYTGTSLLEKFLGELFNDKHQLKIKFSKKSSTQKKEILKAFSLLMLLKRESEKTLCHILSVIEAIYEQFKTEHKIKTDLKELIQSEIIKASEKKSVFELVWLIFFSRYMKLGITEKWIKANVDSDLIKNPFLKSICKNKQEIFNDAKIDLFVKPKDCRGKGLAKVLAVFERKKD